MTCGRTWARRNGVGIGFFSVVVAVGACASGPGAVGGAAAPGAAFDTDLAPRLVVPHFAADDPRVGTAGFVSQTTRMNRDIDGTTYTLMAFAVGDVLTLGAMVRGDFEGVAEWRVGERAFSIPLRRADRGSGDIPASGQPLRGQHGGFDAFDWINVDVPLASWLPDGTLVRLVFRSDGNEVELPESAAGYAASLVTR